MCILLYVKLLWCGGIPYIYGQLEQGVGSVCPKYMCILLYVKLIVVEWYSLDLWSIRGGVWSQSTIGICAFCCM